MLSTRLNCRKSMYGYAFFTGSLLPNYLLVNKLTTKFNGQQLD